MTTVEALRQMRSSIASRSEGRFAFKMFFAFDALPAEVRDDVVRSLEEVFIPTTTAAQRSDGWLARDLHRLPGADRQLWETIESSEIHPWDVLKGFDTAILRASRK